LAFVGGIPSQDQSRRKRTLISVIQGGFCRTRTEKCERAARGKKESEIIGFKKLLRLKTYDRQGGDGRSVEGKFTRGTLSRFWVSVGRQGPHNRPEEGNRGRSKNPGKRVAGGEGKKKSRGRRERLFEKKSQKIGRGRGGTLPEIHVEGVAYEKRGEGGEEGVRGKPLNTLRHRRGEKVVRRAGTKSPGNDRGGKKRRSVQKKPPPKPPKNQEARQVPKGKKGYSEARRPSGWKGQSYSAKKASVARHGEKSVMTKGEILLPCRKGKKGSPEKKGATLYEDKGKENYSVELEQGTLPRGSSCAGRITLEKHSASTIGREEVISCA